MRKISRPLEFLKLSREKICSKVLTDLMGKKCESAMVEYNSVRHMCPELDSFDMTLQQLETCHMDTLQSMVIEQFKQPDFKMQKLAKWATTLITRIGCKKGNERKALEGLDPDLLEFIGLGRKTFSKWKVNSEETKVLGLSRKKEAPQYMDLNPTKIYLVENYPAHIRDEDAIVIDIQLEIQESFSTQLVLLEAEDTEHYAILDENESRDMM